MGNCKHRREIATECLFCVPLVGNSSLISCVRVVRHTSRIALSSGHALHLIYRGLPRIRWSCYL